MPFDETPGNYGLIVDRGYPTGNSPSTLDNRFALHTKIRNDTTEAIPVFVVDAPVPSTEVVQVSFNSIINTPQNAQTLLLTYTVPVAKQLLLQRVDVGGSNIGSFDLQIDLVLLARRRTFYGAGLNESFVFVGQAASGYLLNAGQTVEILVTNPKSYLGDYEVTLQGVLLG